MDQQIYWIWIQMVLGCGSHRSNAVVGAFKSAKTIYEMSDAQLEESRQFTKNELKKMRSVSIEQAQRVYERCQELKCRVITPEDEVYPQRLRNIYAMPLVLYVRGNLKDLDQTLAIAVVGTRRYTNYGKAAAEFISSQLARWGTVIVSGIALGIDAIALKSAIRAGGKTVGVLGSGIDVFYPRENQKMIEWIGEHHILMTEYPPGTRPMRAHFPARNRIMSGLSLGTLVVEAPASSGALITASHALEQGKDIFAVPGRIGDKTSAGALELIKQGAKLITSAEDILIEYERLYPEQLQEYYKIQLDKMAEQVNKRAVKPTKDSISNGEENSSFRVPEGLNDLQEKIYRFLLQGSAHVQSISASCGISVAVLLPILTEMEISGLIFCSGVGKYALTSDKK